MNTGKSEITKKALAEALLKILQTKPLHKISIKEIVGESGLNRQTFYYHFKDIFALVEWTFKKELIQIYDDEQPQIWHDGFKRFLEILDNNRTVCQNVLRSMDDRMMSLLFQEEITRLVGIAIQEVSEIELSETYHNMMITYFTLSFGSIIEHWIFRRLDYSIDTLIEYAYTIIKDQLLGYKTRMEL